MRQMNTFLFDVFVCDVCWSCQFSTLKGETLSVAALMNMDEGY